jgi:hypothetical protein
MTTIGTKWFALLGFILFLGVAVAPSVNAKIVEDGIKEEIIDNPSNFFDILNDIKLPNLFNIIQSILLYRFWTSIYLLAYSLEEVILFQFPALIPTKPVMFISGWIQVARLIIWFKFWYEISEKFGLGWEDELFPDL